jgi:hypothetical protein
MSYRQEIWIFVCLINYSHSNIVLYNIHKAGTPILYILRLLSFFSFFAVHWLSFLDIICIFVVSKSYCYFIHFFKMPPHKLEQIIGEQSKEKEFCLKWLVYHARRGRVKIGVNSIQALTCNWLSQNRLHTLMYCIPPNTLL